MTLVSGNQKVYYLIAYWGADICRYVQRDSNTGFTNTWRTN